MTHTTFLFVLIFSLVPMLGAQNAPTQAQDNSQTRAEHHQQMMEMHKQEMAAMKADAEKMKASLAEMKANLSTMKDTNELARWRNNVDLWQTVVDHMEQMQKRMDSMGSGMMRDHMVHGDGVGNPSATPPDKSEYPQLSNNNKESGILRPLCSNIGLAESNLSVLLG
jgi:hypothetical protein